ncbi:cysteine desulfurase family protein [Tenacibaculum maritimum]|uniref:cysteine desulfurase n=1 Tax=Tenacibaculum maritimum NCIMB 2154 TaxID=1349785 RepID=A0A2H1E8P9_9FLAO|nr:cysteine desulfurase family protein [Tenacibaculum maritimum]MCD9584852.1 cysteine desulfurase [Tenacibaculum maritimum]MCD9620700.1 cysteine desulfurase [Tenacibaculum maritimum]MCD9626959.1 cysteine desulfurase [Tenacibaculum maritimum]MCD9630566.1 cysteine desulfurase [Tenacibaculum maritimum]MCD9632665.1 cysteine desulfurase [Tenacibaculum maritimum]
MKDSFIYLDYNASTPNDPKVINAMLPFLTNHYGNPSSIHKEGQKAKDAIEKARMQVANSIGCSTNEIIFTSGGTESNNHAIIGTAMSLKNKGNHIITSSIEHPAVIEVCKYLESQGFKITYLNVNKDGIIDLNDLKNTISSKTILITIMHANNETGSIQPIEKIGMIAKEHGIPLHTDASQSFGKIKVDVKELNVNLLTLAGHKVYAPKGIGALYIKKGTPINKLMHGAKHEYNKRPGTESTMLIVGLGAAAQLATEKLHENKKHMESIRNYLLKKLTLLKVKSIVNSNLTKTLPNTLNISFKNCNSNTIIHKLKDKLALSSGSACHAGSANVSPILKATLCDFTYAKGTFRFSVGKNTSKEEIDNAILLLTKEIVP